MGSILSQFMGKVQRSFRAFPFFCRCYSPYINGDKSCKRCRLS